MMRSLPDVAIISPPPPASINAPQAKSTFISFDGGVRSQGMLQQPDRYRYWDRVATQLPCIPRGAGLSYAAASFLDGGLSVSHASFDRVTGFDAASNIVEVESGITLFALHRFLSTHGLYLPVQPGHGRITVGGCIAADVHGKNHARDGTFMNQVESLTLFHPSHGLLELSRELEPELFHLTCGGYGLTGHIIRARVRAMPIPSPAVELKAAAFSDAMEGLEQLGHAAQEADFAYTWHDMASAGKSFGSGYVFQARFVPDGHEASSQSSDAELPQLSADGRGAWPVGLLNSLSVHALNVLYRRQQRPALAGKSLALQDALFPVHKAQLYFKLFGARGFHEYQVILPLEAMREYLDAIRTCIGQRRLAITLASAKAFDGPRELLRFTGKGVCLALNFPRGEAAHEFMPFLDERVIALGGVPNIIKDSRLPRAVVDACYPGAGEFRAVLRSFDPKRMFRSELSERLGL
ncbi:FAD-binding oxidoreductase [Sulfuriferula sp.]|uniref:FAD-binding oxidoreductase n=1 Tax=Sulfuriferula sp. TaxID=2025307 RepID=UPI00272FCFBA|nr:FAD-binding oxidoreductase [Sulfuriferula sp.]MDP2025015.1 FAD-binding oxidoreductase [Sulfuriferula sp.]